MKQKKGAIELSMTTIIVIVLGVTLLILGLAFIQGLFAKVTSLSEQSFATADKLIQEQMGSSERFYISALIFEIESGKSISGYVGLQNFESDAEFEITAISGGSEKIDDWFVLPSPDTIRAGEKKGYPILIKVPSTKAPGTSATFTIKALKDKEEYDSQSIIIKVKE